MMRSVSGRERLRKSGQLQYLRQTNYRQTVQIECKYFNRTG